VNGKATGRHSAVVDTRHLIVVFYKPENYFRLEPSINGTQLAGHLPQIDRFAFNTKTTKSERQIRKKILTNLNYL